MTKRRNVMLEPNDLSDKNEYILASNHTGMPDPLIISMALNWGLQQKLMPYRFFIINRFFFPPLGFYLRLVGGFPAHKHDRLPYGLEVAYEALDKKQMVVIFPEGKISKNSQQTFEPKSGVSVLAQRQSAKVIPVRVRWDRTKGIIRGYEVAIGKPISGKHKTPQQIMDVVYSLKFE